MRTVLAYHPLADALQFVDQEMGHRYVVLKGREFGSTTRVTSQNGPVIVRQVLDRLYEGCNLTEISDIIGSCMLQLSSLLGFGFSGW